MTNLPKSCANCSSLLQGEEDKMKYELLSKSQIRAALTSTYKLDYLHVLTTVLSKMTRREDDPMVSDHHPHQEKEIELCTECIKVLTNLIKYHDDFNRLRRLTSYLGRTINKLDLVVQELQVHVAICDDGGHRQSYHHKHHSDVDGMFKPVEIDFDDDHPMDMGSPAGVWDDENNYDDDDVPPVTKKLPPSAKAAASSSSVSDKGPWVRLIKLRPDQIPGGQGEAEVVSTTSRVRRSSRPVQPVVASDKINIDTVDIGEDSDDGSFTVFMTNDERDADFQPDDDDDDETKKKKEPGRKRIAKQANPTRKIREPNEKIRRPAAGTESEEKDGPTKEKEERVSRNRNAEPPTPSPCPLCEDNVELPSTHDLVDHLLSEIHTPEKSRFCAICSKEFPTQTSLKNHMRGHVGLKSSPCPHCDRVYSRWMHLKMHLAEQHSDHPALKEYKCRLCPSVFTVRKELSIHFQTHRPHECDRCDKKFREARYLRNHLKSHGRRDARAAEKEAEKAAKAAKILNTCRNCHQQVPDLTDHLRTCTKPVDIRHKCDLCDKIYKTAHTLKEHKLLHSGTKKFICHYCGRKFAQIGVMKRHVLLHTGETPFKCPICGHGYRQKGTMDQHIRAFHNGEKLHLCTECGLALTARTSLQRHMQIHTGILPYKCQICGACFPDLRPLKKHKLTHQVQEKVEEEQQDEEEAEANISTSNFDPPSLVEEGQNWM